MTHRSPIIVSSRHKTAFGNEFTFHQGERIIKTEMMSQKTGTNFVKNKKKYFLIYPRPVRCQKENLFFYSNLFFHF